MISIISNQADLWKDVREILISVGIPEGGINIRVNGEFTIEDKVDIVGRITHTGKTVKLCEVYRDTVVEEENRMEIQIVHKTIS